MRTPRLAVPGAQAMTLTGATARARAIIAAHTATPVTLPMDGATGGTGGDGGGGAPAGGDGGAGPAPTGPPAGGGDTAGGPGQPAPPVVPSPPTPAGPPATPPGPPAPTGYGDPLAGVQPAGSRPMSERSLDEFPPEIRGYIESLRRESGDNRVKAKTAEETAAKAADAAKEEWAERIAKAFGLVTDEPGDQGEQLTPEQRVEQVTAQLETERTDHGDALRELAIWKAAHTAGGNPQRLTDSRTFMRQVAGLDPTAEDFGAKVAAAIGAAVEADDYYKAAPPPGQVPAVLPPVPSGGEFAGGPRGDSTQPQTVDDFRAARREARAGRQ